MVQSCPGPRRRLVSQPSPMLSASPRQDQVVPRSEEHVAAGDDHAAVLGRGEIDVTAQAETRPIRQDVAVDAQPRHAAVGKDAQPQVRRATATLDGKDVVRIAGQRGPRQNLRPLGARHIVGRRHAWNVTRLERAGFGIVPLEVGRLDVHDARDSRSAEADDAPVVAGLPAAARFPPVHPLPALRVLALAPSRRVVTNQVLLRREELVVGRDDRRPEPFGGEVDEIESARAPCWTTNSAPLVSGTTRRQRVRRRRRSRSPDGRATGRCRSRPSPVVLRTGCSRRSCGACSRPA